MLSLSEIYIFSHRAEVLVFKTYRYVNADTRSVFAKRLKEVKRGQLPPHFVESDVTYYYIKRGGLYFVASSLQNISAVLVIELLCRLYHVCKDFCGVISEDSVKANVLLIQELLDEILDLGYVQLASTEKLKPYIQSDPVLVRPSRSPSEDVAARLLGFESRVAPSSAADRPVTTRKHQDQVAGSTKNEIFVDVIERMNTVIGPNGTVMRSEVNGSVNMRSFLAGNPSIKIAVNEDLIINQDKSSSGYGSHVQLNCCTFHPTVKLDDFEESRILVVQPPAGEFSLMNYTVSGDLPSEVPFQVKVFVGEAEQSRDTELVLRIKGTFSSNTHAVNVIVKVPVSKHVTSITQQLSGSDQTAEPPVCSGPARVEDSRGSQEAWSMSPDSG
ncbi:AP-4 complex subunit mu-1-like [Liolophura sinensis]|uniref:AP-4 complex subunit mu-1-like n=1 Tax=Liolophura sinensis TaxID=3198878 RepID=UPI003159263D